MTDPFGIEKINKVYISDDEDVSNVLVLVREDEDVVPLFIPSLGIEDDQVKTNAENNMTYAPLAGPFAPTGFTGSVAPSRYVGGTIAGPPTTGTFAVGDFVIDLTGIVWICTIAGAPGTWVDASSSGRELARAEGFAAQAGISTATDVTGCSITFTVGSRPVDVMAYAPYLVATLAGTAVALKIRDGASANKRQSTFVAAAANDTDGLTTWEHITTPGEYTRKMVVQRTAGAGTITIGAGVVDMTHFIAAYTR